MRNENSKKWLVITLISIIVVLVGFIIYAFGIRPAISGYVINAQNEGAQIAVNYIVSQVAQNGYVQIPVGNQTLVLIPYQQPQGTSEQQ